MNRKDRRQQQAQNRTGAAASGAPPQVPGAGPAALFAQAGAAFQAGRLAEAEQLLRQTLQLDPASADVYNALGMVCGQKGAAREAREHFRKAVALRPGSADFANNLGIAELNSGDLEGAARSFEKAVALNPSLAQAHHNLGLAHQKRGDFDKAIVYFRRALALVPNYASARLNLGNALSDKGSHDEAIAELRALVKLAPQSREAHYNLALALKTARRFEEGATAARAALAVDRSNIEARNLLATCLSGLERYDEALAESREVVAFDPKCVEAHNRIGTVLTNLGRFDEAVAAFEASLVIRPDDADALLGVTSATKAYSTPAMAERIEAALSAAQSHDQRATLHFALGQIYDSIGDYDRAFENYRAGNELAAPVALFDAKIWSKFVDRVIAEFDPDFFAQGKFLGCDSRRPVFIVGMPRSGTTLVEQIIASHPRVAAGGELEIIDKLIAGLPERLGIESGFPESAAQIDEAAARDFVHAYLAGLEQIDAKALRVTDKMPLNFQNLGLIALLFPRATFIHCRRDPLDTCLSCYFAHFDRQLGFSYSLENLGTYYRGYRRLMAHWRKVLPVNMLEVDYEDMIADQEGMSRKIIAHCGLEWDDRCLAFHMTERPVATASAWQVRQPLYKTAVERWRRYQRFLGPLQKALAGQDG